MDTDIQETLSVTVQPLYDDETLTVEVVAEAFGYKLDEPSESVAAALAVNAPKDAVIRVRKIKKNTVIALNLLNFLAFASDIILPPQQIDCFRKARSGLRLPIQNPSPFETIVKKNLTFVNKSAISSRKVQKCKRFQWRHLHKNN